MTALAGRVNMAFDDTMFEWDPDWTAIDQAHPNLVTSYAIDRGRAYELERTEGGRATVELIDPNGVLDPTNAGGPYYGQIVPLLQVALCRWDPMEEEWQTRYRGFVSDLDYDFDPSQQFNRLTLELVDLFEILGAIDMQLGEFGDTPPVSNPGTIFFDDGPMDARIVQVLGNANVPADYYVVFSGNVHLSQTVMSPGETPLTAIQEAAEAEWSGVASVYVDRHGRLNAHGRYARFDPAAVIAGGGEALRWDYHQWAAGDLAAVEADAGTVAQLRQFGFNLGVSKIINHATAYPQWIHDGAVYRSITDAEIAAQTVQDLTSIGLYGKRSWSAPNLQVEYDLVDSADALETTHRVAEYYVANMAAPHVRINRVGFRSIRTGRVGSSITWKLLSRVDISDQIAITVGSPGGGGFDSIHYYVEGVHETAKALNPDYDDVTVTLDLSPVAYFDDVSMFPPLP